METSLLIRIAAKPVRSKHVRFFSKTRGSRAFRSSDTKHSNPTQPQSCRQGQPTLSSLSTPLATIPSPTSSTPDKDQASKEAIEAFASLDLDGKADDKDDRQRTFAAGESTTTTTEDEDSSTLIDGLLHLDPLQENDEAILGFTQDELIAVLDGLGGGDDRQEEHLLLLDDDDDDDQQLEVLPEIEILTDEDDLLEPIDNLEAVFDEDDEEEAGLSPGSSSSRSEEDQHRPQDTTADDDNNNHVTDLLEQLGDLKLLDPFQGAPDDDDFETLEVPPYFYCQPCAPQLNEGSDDIDELLQLSNLLSIHDTTMPSLIQEQQQHLERPAALEAAKPLARIFDDNAKEHMCLGHRERMLGVHTSDCGRYIASASQDSTARIWKDNTLIGTLPHANEYECLRVAWASSTWGSADLDRNQEHAFVLAVGGADGKVCLWSCKDPERSKWKLLATLDHSTLSHFQAQGEDDKPQIYALQFIDDWNALPDNDDDVSNSFLLTSSDDHVHLWEIDGQKKARKDEETTSSSSQRIHLREVMSLRFGDLHDAGYGVNLCQVSGTGVFSDTLFSGSKSSSSKSTPAFGGDRNPHNLIFVFDASYCQTNGLLGVALSDGSLRLMNGRGVCLTILQLPGVQAHLTSFAWDSSGQHLATSVANGCLITWKIVCQSDGSVDTSCSAVFDGGHDVGRPLFGASYIAGDELLVSWGSDGRLCLWDAKANTEVHEPLRVLLYKPDYPIYAVNVRPERMVVAGGGSESGFIGIPMYIYDLVEEQKQEVTKKAKTTEESI